MISRIKSLAAAAGLALALGAAAPAQANVIQLGFILDRSGSIGSGNWSTITTGLANAINTLIPSDGTYEISVVSFASSASTNVNHVLVDSAAAKTSVTSAITGIAFTGGSTNMAAGFTNMTAALTTSPLTNLSGQSYVNLATDGVADSDSATLAARNAMTAAGIDNISIEAIGSGVDAAFLQNSLCFPQACDTSSPYNFPSQGFYIAVANAGAYAAAISNKIQIVTGQVPEPGTMLLLGASLLGFGFARRRKV